MSLELRDYQQQGIDNTRLSMKKNRRVIAVYSQGAGKSVICAFMAENSVSKGNRTMVLTHRKEIFRQNFDKMDKLGMKVQQISQSTKSFDPDGLMFVGMSQTVVARCKKDAKYRELIGSMDFIIIDECHRGEHDDIFEYINEKCWVVGLTATCLRNGKQKQLGLFYSDIIRTISTQELIDLNFLTPSKHFSFQAPILDDVEIDKRTGDYKQGELQKKFQDKTRYTGIISNYNRICPNTKAIVFTTGSEHCVELCQAFNDACISAKYLLSSKMPETDELMSGKRERLLESFKNGEFRVIVSVGVLDTGFDEPTIETVILDLATKSYTKYAQSVGRGSRIFDGKKFFYVLDFGANVEKFGTFESPSPAALWHDESKGGAAPSKECPEDRKDCNGNLGCGRLVRISEIDCPWCGYHWSTEKEIYEVELTEIIKGKSESEMTISEWAVAKKLQGWSNQRILIVACTKNAGHKYKAFLDASRHLRNEDGTSIDPKYFYSLKRFILDKKRGSRK